MATIKLFVFSALDKKTAPAQATFPSPMPVPVCVFRIWSSRIAASPLLRTRGEAPDVWQVRETSSPPPSFQRSHSRSDQEHFQKGCREDCQMNSTIEHGANLWR